MALHYIPRYYLEGFSIGRSRVIWVYDKRSNRRFSTRVDSTASETAFYSPEVERYLANMVEEPANEVLGKIRERKQITDTEKRALAEYVAAMVKRVPGGRELFGRLAPKVAERISDEYASELRRLAGSDPAKSARADRLKAKIQGVLREYTENPPKEFWLDNIPPARSPGMVAAIVAMSWCFLTCDEPAFLTSDNPVFWFVKKGLARPDSELTFPISSHVTLWATWSGTLARQYVRVNQHAVAQVNRRTASRVTRYGFHCCDEPWILPLLLKCR